MSGTGIGTDKGVDDANADANVDVIVAGSGAAGMSAALSAKLAGASVLLLEKTDRIGGSTAISGGAVWTPLNHKSAAAGHPDDHDKVWTYLMATVGAAGSEAMLRRYLEAGPQMIEALERDTALRLTARTFSPDYYPDRPGAAMGGRSLDPDAFDGRLLGKHFSELRDPLPEFVVLGGMMVNLTDARHLLNVTKSFESWKHGMKLVIRFFADRLRGYHRGTRLLLGNALAARLFRSVLDVGIPYRLNAGVRELIVEGGEVVGVRIGNADGSVEALRARKGVILATGGFPWDADAREALYPKPTGPWSMSPQANAGDGIRIAQLAGAARGTDHASPAFWAPISILEKPDGTTVRYPHLVWDRAKPGLIAVNSAGRRFVNESNSYHEFVLGMYRSHKEVPTFPAFLVCDSDFIQRWGLGLALPGGRPREHLVSAGYLVTSDSLRALAAQLGIDADALAASVRQMNEAAVSGVDNAFGKGSTEYNRYLGDGDHKPNPCLGPIAKAPFYAVRVVAGDIGTAAGIVCDGEARALDAQGAVIPGLHVAGNDMQSVMGGEYPAPGITLGPALTFGWVAGRAAAGRAQTI